MSSSVGEDLTSFSLSNEGISQLPNLSVRASPRDANWIERLKEELQTLIAYVKINKQSDSDWFQVNPTDSTGVHWSGHCWLTVSHHKYVFDLTFELPVGYPETPFDICLPELDAKTPKMYHGAKICLSAHFKPLWCKNVPHYGIVHALALGLAPWLAAEIPFLVEEGTIDETDSYKKKK
jgi:ufm1-conjugating enzyme 1